MPESKDMIKPFKLEEYLTQYEFTAPYLLCCSDVETLSMQEILNLADDRDKKLWHELRLGYTEPYGMPILRACIAGNLYPGLCIDNILCFAGAEEGIFAALYSLCAPQDHVIVLGPCYQSLREVPSLKGASVTQVLLREENAWRIDLEAIKKSINVNTKGVVINFPHNPTGQVITKEELLGLCFLCKQYDLWLFSDEVYQGLGASWSQSAAVVYEKALSLNVMSKSFGLAGLRVGWIACQDTKLLTQIKQMKDYLSICNSAPSEILALIALKNKDFILRRNNKIVENNLALIDAFIEKHKDVFEWVRPQGGCIGFVKYKGNQTVDDFCKALVREKGVLLMPASIYDYPSNHFRIGFGRINMPQSLQKLEEFLTSYKTMTWQAFMKVFPGDDTTGKQVIELQESERFYLEKKSQ